ncbi:MAG: LVIVD repeat-containing protein [Panacagrimonas sp.]
MSSRNLLQAIWFGAGVMLVGGCGQSPDIATGATGQDGAVARASCGPGSSPETGLQGQVSREDRLSGRSLEGYSCNLRKVGQYQGEGASWVNPSHDRCAYMATAFLGLATKQSPGVQVIDVRNPANPVLSTNLTTPAFLLGTWETLKVNEARKLLGGVAVAEAIAPAFIDLYDLSADCANPVHLNGIGGTPLELPANVLGHEGNFSPDGNTYWSTGLFGGSITAIDVSDPTSPRILYTGLSGFIWNHGIEFSPDGNRAYLANGLPGGLIILDISDIQNRVAVPTVRQISSINWNVASVGQHALPVFYNGKPYLFVADEFASEGVRVFDISDETDPKLVSQIQLEIQRPEQASARAVDTAGNGFFGYEAHYCDVDRQQNPTAMACGFMQSGVRVFDILNPARPREIAYFNPPAQAGKASMLQGSEHATGLGLTPTVSDIVVGGLEGAGNYVINLATRSDANLSTDWCSSPPRFVGDQLWVTCQDNGFMVLEFTNGAFPLN